MNERDSEWVMGSFLRKGFVKAGSPDEADVVIFNTCSVRKHAEDRMISNMGILARLKEKRPGLMLGLMGCTAEYYGKELFKKLPSLDFVCGANSIHKLTDLVEKLKEEKEKAALTGLPAQRPPETDSYYRADKNKASVLISRGCGNFCSYCIVPYVRGPERSRMPDDILKEIEGLIKRKIANITLLGQNVNSYGKDLGCGVDFVGLLKMLDGLEGKKRIEFMTSHPKDASIELFEAMRDFEWLSKHLHLPVQSGSDKILKAMNRGYDSKYYINKVKYFRKIVPGGTLTTDIIVGFPEEAKEDFEATKRLVKEVQFNAAYIFKYSPRPPALSSKIKDDVPRDVKERRHRELLELQKSISKRLARKRDR